MTVQKREEIAESLESQNERGLLFIVDLSCKIVLALNR